MNTPVIAPMWPATSDESWIGTRIADLRRRRGWTLAVLAGEIDLSTTQLSRIESGARRASVGTLIQIARAFGNTLSELVADEPTTRYHVVRRRERAARPSANGTLIPLSGTFPGLEAVHLTLSDEPDTTPARHEGDEWLYVLDGVVAVHLDGDDLTLDPGDALHFRARTPHTVHSVGQEPAQVLLVTTPH